MAFGCLGTRLFVMFHNKHTRNMDGNICDACNLIQFEMAWNRLIWEFGLEFSSCKFDSRLSPWLEGAHLTMHRHTQQMKLKWIKMHTRWRRNILIIESLKLPCKAFEISRHSNVKHISWRFGFCYCLCLPSPYSRLESMQRTYCALICCRCIFVVWDFCI